MTSVEVRWALDAWEVFGAPHLDVIPGDCETREDRHTVYVDAEVWGAEYTDTMEGLTATFFAGEGHPNGMAYVGVRSDDPTTLIHELGHLWFNDHHPNPRHVLAEYVNRFDWRWDGVSRAFAIAELETPGMVAKP